MSSAKRQKSVWTRKWATAWGSWPRAEAAGELAELLGRLLGDALDRRARPERHRVGPHPAQGVDAAGIRERREVDDVLGLGGVGEVGADDDPVEIGDDQQRRVFEVVLVPQELVVGLVEVLVRPLVLPGEVTAIPDVGPPLAAGRFGGALLEGVGRAVLVDLGRRRHIQDAAELEEVLLRGGALGAGDAGPVANEIDGVHAGLPVAARWVVILPRSYQDGRHRGRGAATASRWRPQTDPNGPVRPSQVELPIHTSPSINRSPHSCARKARCLP